MGRSVIIKTGFWSAMIFSLILFMGGSCNRTITGESAPQSKKFIARTELVNPLSGKTFRCGERIPFEISRLDSSVLLDSVQIYIKGEQITTLKKKSKYQWNSSGARVGINVARVKVFYNDSLVDTHTLDMTLLSDIQPKKYDFRVIRQFPHDEGAYTQGLLYEDGYLYEGTGQPGKSSIRKVQLGSGIPVKKLDIDKQFFGEGIAILNDNLYQLTYRARVGFIYDKETLELIRQFDLQVNEGWGLTEDGKNLIMSDGSSRLFILDPEYLSQLDEIEVFDYKGMVPNLNELEYVNGSVFANIYGQTRIVVIDLKTGKVTGELDLKSLMPEGFNDMDHVLNGIAFNPETKHFYVTGKYWPVLYEIKIFNWE